MPDHSVHKASDLAGDGSRSGDIPDQEIDGLVSEALDDIRTCRL